MEIKELASQIKDAIEWLKDEQMGCVTIKLDDKLAVCVGWQDGYDAKDETVIHAEDDPTWGLVAGIKVYTSDDMLTDYDFINAPFYKNGDVWDTTLSILSEDEKELEGDANYLLNEYESMKDLNIADDGEIIEEKEEEVEEEKVVEENKKDCHVNLNAGNPAENMAAFNHATSLGEEKEENKNSNESVYEMKPEYDSRKSFYGKAHVDDKGNVKVLYSYDTPVAMIKDGEVILGKATNRGYPYLVWKISQTTLRHVKEFLKQNGFKADSIAQMEKDYKADFIKESLVEGPNPGARVTMLDKNEVIIKEVGHSALVKKGDGHYIVKYAPGYFVYSFDAENDEEAIKRFMNESLKEEFVGNISEVEELPSFKETRKELGITDEELNKLKDIILKNPNTGDVIPDCNGARKIRISLGVNNKGKSHGARIIYVNVYFKDKAYLIDIYSKNEKQDLSKKEKRLISSIIDILKQK